MYGRCTLCGMTWDEQVEERAAHLVPDEGHHQQLISTWRDRALTAEAKLVEAARYIEDNKRLDDWGVECVSTDRLAPILELQDV